MDLADPVTFDKTPADIRIDIARRTTNLSHELASLLCELREKNMTEIARHSGVPKSTLYGRLSELQSALSPLREYLR